ncbi:MAG: hypothetical protein RL013_1847 [Bacteroidota bacterium]|jgi:hypothetical protein
MIYSRLCLIALAVATALLFSCNDDNSRSGPAVPSEGHSRMIAILDSIFRNASHLDCYNLNGRKAAFLKDRADQSNMFLSRRCKSF